jgi:3-hydroxybutyryl-CoA dehydrogenase
MVRDAEEMLEAHFARASDIDTAMRLGAGHPKGPFAYAASLHGDERRSVGDIAPPDEASADDVHDALEAWTGPVGVVGTGQMASGIVECIAKAGVAVIVLSRSEASSERVRSIVGRSLEKSAARGRISADDAAAAQSAITFTRDVADLAASQLVIEAVAEDLSDKHEVVAALHAVLKTDAVIATNTSSFTVEEVRGTLAPGRDIIALHFFNPAPAMKLLEIVTGSSDFPLTSKAIAFAQMIGKTPVTCGDERGFIVNRLLIPYLNDAVALVGEGIPADVVDAAVKEQAHHPMGPLALVDLIGIDVTIAALHSLHEATGDRRMVPHSELTDLLASRRLGRKSGHGFFSYDN